MTDPLGEAGGILFEKAWMLAFNVFGGARTLNRLTLLHSLT